MSSQGEQISKIWNSVKEELKKNNSQDINFYNSIIVPTSLCSLENGEATIATDTMVAKRVLSASLKWKEEIENALKRVTQSSYKAVFVSQEELKKKRIDSEKNGENKERKYFQNSFLRPEYTFDNFVVGNSNREASQAALFVAAHQGQLNPLFIYSKSGLGKTHLLHAIGNYVRNANPQMHVLYITSSDFIEEFVGFVLGNHEEGELMNFFRGVDYLLIDDVQFLAGKEATCQMFFNVFNIMVGQGKQIVITADRAPQELKGLEDRLVSRFSQGLSVSIDPPEKKTLIEILKAKIKGVGYDASLFDEDALEYIATHNSQNVRVLEGALNRILFFNIRPKDTDRITLDLVKEAFEKDSKHKRKPGELTPEIIVHEVASYYNLTDQQILSRIRTSQIALARAIAMYLTRKLLSLSYGQIGKAFGGKDHSTVMTACTKIESLAKSDELTRNALAKLEKNLKE